MLQDELWMKQRKNRTQTAEVGFLKTKPRKPSFQFLNFEVGSVQFLGNRYPKFSPDSAHPYVFQQLNFFSLSTMVCIIYKVFI